MLNKSQKVQPTPSDFTYKEILETKIAKIYTSSWEVLWKHKIWANELQSIGLKLKLNSVLVIFWIWIPGGPEATLSWVTIVGLINSIICTEGNCQVCKFNTLGAVLPDVFRQKSQIFGSKSQKNPGIKICLLNVFYCIFINNFFTRERFSPNVK